MTPEEVAAKLECKPTLVYKLCAEGRIGHARIGFGRGKLLITGADVEQYLESVRVNPRPAATPTPEARRGRRPDVRDYCQEWAAKRAKGKAAR